jgi:hypothetical protein
MSNNRDFNMRTEWIKFLEEHDLQHQDVHYFGSEDIRDDLWKVFKRHRPITAHILEEVFGQEKAMNYAMEISADFTEQKAIGILRYTYKPRPHNSKTNSRISNIPSSINKD